VPTIERDRHGHGLVRFGPRVLALAIPGATTVTADHGIAGLVDLAVVPTSDEHAGLRLVDDPATLAVVPGGVEALFCGDGGSLTRRLLSPLGTSALRRVTFPVCGD
jgi:hypothetical protein